MASPNLNPFAALEWELIPFTHGSLHSDLPQSVEVLGGRGSYFIVSKRAINSVACEEASRLKSNVYRTRSWIKRVHGLKRYSFPLLQAVLKDPNNLSKRDGKMLGMSSVG